MKRTLLLVIFVLAFAVNLRGLGTTFGWHDLEGLTRVHAQTGGPSAPLGASYDLTWWTVDNGGGMSVGGGSPASYTLVGTAGQPDAGAALTGGGFTLVGGFWGAGSPAGEPPQYRVYLPVVIR